MRRLVILAFLIAIGLLLNVLSCVIWKNWYPIFVVITYLFAPLPNFLCGSCNRGGGASGFGTSEERNGWKDSGFFITGALLITGLALPMTLAHVKVIEVGAMVMAVFGGVIVYSAILLYSHVFQEKTDSFFG